MHAAGVTARVVDAEGASGTAPHLFDELLRRVRRGVAVDDYLTDVRAGAARNVEDDQGLTRSAVEVGLRIDRGVDVAVAAELLLQGHGAPVDGVEREDVAAAEVDVTLGAAAIVAPQTVEVDLSDAIVERKHDRDVHAAGRGVGVHPHVAEVAGGVERLDRLLHVADSQPLPCLERQVLAQHFEIELRIGAQRDGEDRQLFERRLRVRRGCGSCRCRRWCRRRRGRRRLRNRRNHDGRRCGECRGNAGDLEQLGIATAKLPVRFVAAAEAGFNPVLTGELVARDLQGPVGSDLPFDHFFALGVVHGVDDEDVDTVRHAFLERELRPRIACRIECAGVVAERIGKRQHFLPERAA